MTGPRLGFVKIIVADLARAERFYTALFGMQRTGSFATDTIEEIILRGAGGASLVLYSWNDGRALVAGSNYGPIGFHVDDVDATFADAVASGARPVRAPASYGTIRAAFLADPEGHEIELVAR